MAKIKHRSKTFNLNNVTIYAINKTGSLFDVDYFILESTINGNFKSMTYTKQEQSRMLEEFFKFEDQLKKPENNK